jgi:IMP and pyridine-specific 5'-nucleotidase
VAEHRLDPRASTLSRLVPVGEFFTPLPLGLAVDQYDTFSGLTRRRFVAPNFAEVRHVVNMAQVHASAPALKLITFDADGTLYEDGAHLSGEGPDERDASMIRKILALLEAGLHVAIVTAAGYPGEAWRFDARLTGLLAAFRSRPPELMSRFMVMGGECNYLLRCMPPDAHLEFVPVEQWQLPEMLAWREDDVKQFLDAAEAALLAEAERQRLPVHLIRKERSCGVVPKVPEGVVYETLEEIALAVQAQLQGSLLPFCAFNGGGDVFVDVGNKLLGLQALQRYLSARPEEVLHVGDRFTLTGNDAKVRGCCPVLWVADPAETAFFIQLLIADFAAFAAAPRLSLADLAALADSDDD